MMMPPMAMIGAEIMMLSIISTTICTCCTSLVLRVMSDGVPKWLTSVCEKLSTLRKSAPRTSRPNAMATLEPQYTPMMAAITTDQRHDEHDGARLAGCRRCRP